MAAKQAGHSRGSDISPARITQLAGVAGHAGHIPIHVEETPAATAPLRRPRNQLTQLPARIPSARE